MSLLTYLDLVDLVDQGMIENLSHEQINGASIDVTLGRYIKIEDPKGGVVDVSAKEPLKMREHDLVEEPYRLHPGEFVLASTREIFHLPHDIAFEYKLKSSLARVGLAHLVAGYADPGWHGSVLTLEYHNVTQHHQIVLKYGMPAGQCVFYRGRPVPVEQSYATRGNYNGDLRVTQSKGAR